MNFIKKKLGRIRIRDIFQGLNPDLVQLHPDSQSCLKRDDAADEKTTFYSTTTVCPRSFDQIYTVAYYIGRTV